MLTSMAEVNAAEAVVNGVDNPNLLSVDSTNPVPVKVDELKSEEEKEEENAEVKKEKQEEIKEEEKEAEKKKVESKPESEAVQKRINELTKKRREAERATEYEKTKRLEAETELKKFKAIVPPVDKPNREDFEDQDEYLEALTDWKVEQKLKTKDTEVSKQTKEETEKTELAEAYQEVDAILERGREAHDDYDTLVLDKELLISPDMTEVVMSLEERAHEVFYYLAQHPDESAEISKMSRVKATLAIVKIDEKLTTAAEEAKKKEEGTVEAKASSKEKKISNAPEPIVPVKTTGAVEKDPANMSAKEYRAWRERNKG